MGYQYESPLVGSIQGDAWGESMYGSATPNYSRTSPQTSQNSNRANGASTLEHGIPPQDVWIP